MHATKGNGKLVREIGVFDLLVMPLIICRGAASPGCLDFCFAISKQNSLRSVLLSRLDNLEETLRPDFVDKMIDWILASEVDVMSPHHAGDFWGQQYVDDWGEIARRLPHRRFFTFTKSLDLDLTPLNLDNFVLIKSEGGKWDYKIDRGTDDYSRVIQDIKDKEAGEHLCPDKGGKKPEKKKVCGKTCTYCMEGGHQVRVVFLEKKKGWNGHRLFPKNLPKKIADRIRLATGKIEQLNVQTA